MKALVVVLALALSGCWLQPGFGPERQSSNPFEQRLTEANVAGLREAWSVPNDLGGEPLVTPAAVYVGGVRDVSAEERVLTVRALSRRSGAPLWQRDLPVDPGTGAGALLSVAGDEVLTVRGPLPQPLARFETLDAATGATVATADVPNVVAPATATVGPGVVASRELVLSGGGNVQLAVRSRDTFALRWAAPTGSLVGATEPVLVAHGRVWLSAEVNGVPLIRGYALDGCGAPTCDPTATFPIPPPDPAYEVVGARLLSVTDDDLLLVHRPYARGSIVAGNDLVALTSDGALAWRVRLTELSGVAAAGDTVVAVGDDATAPAGVVVGRSGSATWRAEGAFEGTPVIAGGLVYVASTPAVHVYDADGCGAPTCDELASVDLGPGTGGVYGMSVAGGMLFVNKAGPGGRLFAFAPGAS